MLYGPIDGTRWMLRRQAAKEKRHVGIFR